MDYKRIDVEIRGMSALLMNRLNPESLRARGRARVKAYSTKDDAAKSAYIAEIEGREQLYIPMEAVYSMMINTAKGYRIKRSSVSGFLAGTMKIEPDKIPLGTNVYEVDERAVVIQGQRVLKGRVMIPKWAAKFQIVYNAKYLPEGIEEVIHSILEEAGVRMGLLDFRPQHKGWFGTFAVDKFQPLDTTTEETTAQTTEPAKKSRGKRAKKTA